jgi:hypothetical protein
MFSADCFRWDFSGSKVFRTRPSDAACLERAFSQSNAELNVVADIDSLPVMLALARNGALATISSRAVSMVSRPQILTRRLINPHHRAAGVPLPPDSHPADGCGAGG